MHLDIFSHISYVRAAAVAVTQQQLMSFWACEASDSVAMSPPSVRPLDEPIGEACRTAEGCDLQSGLASLQAPGEMLWSAHGNSADADCTYATWPDAACSLCPESGATQNPGAGRECVATVVLCTHSLPASATCNRGNL